MPRDVCELRGVQPQIEGVEDRTHRGDREVGRDVVRSIPAQRSDYLALADTETPQGTSQTAALGSDVRERALTVDAVDVIGD
jgi:hypothetical protein